MLGVLPLVTGEVGRIINHKMSYVHCVLFPLLVIAIVLCTLSSSERGEQHNSSRLLRSHKAGDVGLVTMGIFPVYELAFSPVFKPLIAVIPDRDVT